MSKTIPHALVIPEGADPILGLHYQLYAYVCGKACIRPSPFPVGDFRTFTAIFTARPDGCRFGIARRVPLTRNVDPNPNTPLFHSAEPTGVYVVWDLLDDQLVRGKRTGPGGFMSPPPAWFMCATEDGAVMKAMMFYDQV